MKEKKWFIRQGLLLSLLSIILAFVSFIKEAVFANFFGITSAADAYTIAIQIPEIFFAVVWESINAIIIPLYTQKYFKNGEKFASAFSLTFLFLILLGTLGFIFCGEFLSSYLIYAFSPGLNLATHNLAASLLRWTLPILFFEAIIRVCVGIANVHKKFAIPKIINCIRNTIFIIFVILFSNKFGIYAAAYAILCGLFIECIVAFFYTRKFEKFNNGINLRDDALKTSFKMAVPLLIGIGTNEVNQLFDKFIASFLNSGSIASLSYASKLSSMFQTVFLANIVTIMYPTYSMLAAENKKDELNNKFVDSIIATLLIGIPIIIGCIFLREEIITIAFKRGNFDLHAVKIVSNIFAFYLIACLFTTLRVMCVKIFTSFCDTKTPMYNSIIGVVINIVLNLILTPFLGAVGLAAASMISSIITCILMFLSVKSMVIKIDYIKIFKYVYKILLSGLFMLLVLFVLRYYYLKLFILNNSLKIVVYSLIVALVGCIIYMINLTFMRVISMKTIINHFAKE